MNKEINDLRDIEVDGIVAYQDFLVQQIQESVDELTNVIEEFIVSPGEYNG
jgi:hypothetical protein